MSSLTSINALAKALKISFERAEKIYSAFMDAYLFLESPIFAYSVRVEKAFPKKVYPVDLGYGRLLLLFVMSEKGWKNVNLR